MITVQVAAQQRNITGTVVSADDGAPLPGVSVKIKGTTQGTSTDVNGKYTIRANQGQVLVFSFIGSATQERAVGTAGQIDIKLAESIVMAWLSTPFAGAERYVRRLKELDQLT